MSPRTYLPLRKLSEIRFTEYRKKYKLNQLYNLRGEKDIVKDFVTSAFRTFNLNLNTLTNRIAFQKSIYLMQELGSVTKFNFVWHNFGPYSQELAQLGQSITIEEINEAILLEDLCAIKFRELKQGQEYNSKFIEMVADIIFLMKKKGIENKEALFNELVRHHSYLGDRKLFDLSISRIKSFNLI